MEKQEFLKKYDSETKTIVIWMDKNAKSIEIDKKENVKKEKFTMKCSKSWKVYGTEGHRQKISFQPSFVWDFSEENDTRIIEVFCSDKTGTNDFVIVKITRNSAEECEKELDGQISDGLFENARTGKIEEIEFSESLPLPESPELKPATVVDIWSRQKTVNINQRKLIYFDNRKQIKKYSAPIIENGKQTEFWAEYNESGKVLDFDEKINAHYNPIKTKYASLVKFNAPKNDPEGILWSKMVDFVKENKNLFFNKFGDFKQRNKQAMQLLESCKI